MVRKCEFCGMSVKDGELFCTTCGNKIDENEDIRDAIIEEDGKSKESITFILVIIVLLLLTIVSFGLYYLLFK